MRVGGRLSTNIQNRCLYCVVDQQVFFADPDPTAKNLDVDPDPGSSVNLQYQSTEEICEISGYEDYSRQQTQHCDLSPVKYSTVVLLNFCPNSAVVCPVISENSFDLLLKISPFSYPNILLFSLSRFCRPPF